MIKEEFDLIIGKQDLIAEMEQDYNALVVELKKDDELCGEPQDELAKSGYPSIQDLLKMNHLAELVFGSYLIREFFTKILPPTSPTRIQHWFDERRSCIVEGESIRFTGICFRKK